MIIGTHPPKGSSISKDEIMCSYIGLNNTLSRAIIDASFIIATSIENAAKIISGNFTKTDLPTNIKK